MVNILATVIVIMMLVVMAMTMVLTAVAIEDSCISRTQVDYPHSHPPLTPVHPSLPSTLHSHHPSHLATAFDIPEAGGDDVDKNLKLRFRLKVTDDAL